MARTRISALKIRILRATAVAEHSPRNLIVAPLCEAALILIAGLAGWLMHRPFLFASLGPTAYELIETPHRPSARPYNIIAGHLIGILAGFAALFFTHAFAAPVVSSHTLPLVRVTAGTLAAALTVLFTLLARATQPAAVATSLLITVGSMQTWQDACAIFAAILLTSAVGEPLRSWRMREEPNL